MFSSTWSCRPQVSKQSPSITSLPHGTAARRERLSVDVRPTADGHHQRLQQIAVPVLSDSNFEVTEAFYMNLSSPTNARIAPPTGELPQSPG